LVPYVTDAGDGVYQITLTPPWQVFTDFISALAGQGPPTFLVDVGPASTSDQLIHALAALGVSRLDYILLTHIHLDHAGAAGHIASAPAATIVCHPKAIPHLVDLSRLWEGTENVLGSVALGYGPLKAGAARALGYAQGFAGSITALLTPGHAAHHVSYFTAPALFVGEACGVLTARWEGLHATGHSSCLLHDHRPAKPGGPHRARAGSNRGRPFRNKAGRLRLAAQAPEQLFFWEQWMFAHASYLWMKPSSAVPRASWRKTPSGCISRIFKAGSGAGAVFPEKQRQRFLGWIRDK
jgi:hypothetical protein